MKRRATISNDSEGLQDYYDAKQYWDEQKKNGPGGRPKAIESPQHLWELACDYFQECDSTPWVKTDYKGAFNTKVEIPTTRPYLWGGFDEFLRSKGVISKLEDYKANRPNEDDSPGPYDEFSDVITRIRNIIRTQKLEGAMVGAYNANIVSAELGLKSKVEVSTPKQVFKINGQTIELG